MGLFLFVERQDPKGGPRPVDLPRVEMKFKKIHNGNRETGTAPTPTLPRDARQARQVPGGRCCSLSFFHGPLFRGPLLRSLFFAQGNENWFRAEKKRRRIIRKGGRSK